MTGTHESSILTPMTVCPNSRSGGECEHCQARKLSVCAALEPNELVALDRLSRKMCFPARETIFEQDEPSDVVYNITSGAVRLYKLLPDGRRQIVGFALTGDFLGLSMGERNVFSADALGEVTACQFSRKHFSDFLDAHPHLLRRLHAFASHELSIAQEQMVILGRRTAEEKVVAFLIGLRNRWSRINGSTVNVPLPMTRQDIGDFLGLTIETVSRMFTKLAKQKSLVITPDGVRLLEPARLEAIAAT
jgi:CRP/FNR family transcriptional regulator, anaerobic regulatory protein